LSNWEPITVKDLIDELSKYPLDTPVIGSGDDCVDYRQFAWKNLIAELVDVSLIKIEQWNEGEVDLEIINRKREEYYKEFWKENSPHGCEILKRFTAISLKV